MKMKKWMSTALIIALVAVNNQGMEQVNGFTSLDFAKNEASDLIEQNTDLSPVSTVTPEGIESYYVTYIDKGEEIHVGCYEAGKTATITLDEKEDNTYEYYRFVGWEDYKGDIHQPGEEVNIYDIPSATFTAVWEDMPHADFYVYYHDELNGRDWSSFEPVVWGKTEYYLLRPEPVEGYVFLGWQHEEKLYRLGDPLTLSEISCNTFTAVWEKIAEPTTPSAIPVETVTPTATPVITPTPSVIPTETITPSKTPIITVTPNAISGETSSITPTETPTNKPNVKPVLKKTKVKITTNVKKKFIAGKKYTLKANRSNTKEKIQWVVSNKKIATINKNTGVLKAKKAGKVTITVICGKVKDSIKIVIKKKS